MEIIQLSPSRWQEFKELRLQALQDNPEAFARSYEEDLQMPDESWIEWLQSIQNGEHEFLFAQIDGRIIGMVGALLEDGENTKHRATIISMYVHPQFREKKVAKTLIKELLHNLNKRNIKLIKLEVITTNTAAIKLYEQCGFKKIGILEKNLLHNNKYMDSYLMTKIY